MMDPNQPEHDWPTGCPPTLVPARRRAALVLAVAVGIAMLLLPPAGPRAPSPASTAGGSTNGRTSLARNGVPSAAPGATPAGGDSSGAAQGGVLGNNPITSPGLRPAETACALPAFHSSDEDDFFQATVACLNAAWRPALESAHLPFSDAHVVTVTAPVGTPCGTRYPTQTALYCNGTIYMTGYYYAEIEHHKDDAGVYFGQLAHEYGHHVQHLAGIMNASWNHRYGVGTDSLGGYATSRRFELQATCFGGTFLAATDGRGTVGNALVQEALKDSGQRGDYPDGRAPDHGSPQVNTAWVRQGFERKFTEQCDTWLAPSASVR